LATRTWMAFPDFHVTIEDQIAEADKVVTRWTARGTHNGELRGPPPFGKRVILNGISIARLVGGQIVETWAEVDSLRMFQQLLAASVTDPVPCSCATATAGRCP
jgi:predicted ester cyclase